MIITDKDLKELIFKIHDCDYFKQVRPDPEADVDSEGDSQPCGKFQTNSYSGLYYLVRRKKKYNRTLLLF